jgi:hypothetical protein
MTEMIAQDLYSHGRSFEQMAAEICRSHGYSVFQPDRELHQKWDLIVNGKRLQVKKRCWSPKRGRSMSYRRSIDISAKGMAYSTQDVDAFAIFYDFEWFVFLSDLVATDGVVKTSLSYLFISPHRNRWDVLAGCGWTPQRQMAFCFDA